MELSDFVQTTLEEILKGVRAAQEAGGKPDRKRGLVNPSHVMYAADHAPKGKYYATTGQTLLHFVQFDVAVTTKSGDKVSGGGKINVLGIASLGSEGSALSKDTTASRIKFEVPISLPKGED